MCCDDLFDCIVLLAKPRESHQDLKMDIFSNIMDFLAEGDAIVSFGDDADAPTVGARRQHALLQPH